MNHSKAMVKLGNIYRNNKNYAQALKLYHQAIELNNFDALAELGFMYQKGYGVKCDSDEAIELFEHAHQNSSAIGTYYLAYMYEYGYGCAMDSNRAETLKNKAYQLKEFDNTFQNLATFLDFLNKETKEKQ